ncbi:MAG: hypothetical protein LC792_26670, partial [Actinobacteria bacterium]|nr:hypothetical protein [Actinomycetota bacterium]
MSAPRQVLDTIEDPFVRRAVGGAYHVKRYLPFYVLGLVWAVSLALVPTIRDDGGGKARQQAAVSSVDTGTRSGAAGGAVEGAAPSSGGEVAGASTATVDGEGLSRGPVASSRRAPIEVTQKASGKTKGG